MKKLRLKFMIYPKLQYSLILSVMWILILSDLIIGIQVLRSFRELREMGEKIGLTSGHPYFTFIEYHEHSLSTSLAWACGISIFVSFFLILFISHRVAGPIVRLKSYFNGIATEGWKTKLQFRKGDFFSDLPEVINKALERK